MYNINDEFRLVERDGLCAVCAHNRADDDPACAVADFDCTTCHARDCLCRTCRIEKNFDWRGNASK